MIFKQLASPRSLGLVSNQKNHELRSYRKINLNEKNPQWNDFVKVQLIQDRCDLLETIQLNENIKVYFNLRGRKWENNGQVSYFTNLEGWRIEKVQAETPMMGAPVPEYKVEDIPPMPEADDLPF